jgi:hypothetical protein
MSLTNTAHDNPRESSRRTHITWALRLLAPALLGLVMLIPADATAQSTPMTSEEYPPIGCNSGQAVTGVRCTGSYCDNIGAYCGAVGTSTTTSRSWTSFVSEEGGGTRYCPGSGIMTGLACNGRYCDNISLECTTFSGVTPRFCYWTGWVSEEYGGTLLFPSGQYAAGMQCGGSYCDNKRFYICTR